MAPDGTGSPRVHSSTGSPQVSDEEQLGLWSSVKPAPRHSSSAIFSPMTRRLLRDLPFFPSFGTALEEAAGDILELQASQLEEGYDGQRRDRDQGEPQIQ